MLRICVFMEWIFWLAKGAMDKKQEIKLEWPNHEVLWMTEATHTTAEQHLLLTV